MESKPVTSAIVAVFCVALAAGGCAQTKTARVNNSLEAESALALMESAPPSSHLPPAPGWYTCDVHRVGPHGTNIYMRLSSGSFNQRYFFASTDMKKEILATCLTAVTLQKKVKILIQGTATVQEILSCFLLN